MKYLYSQPPESIAIRMTDAEYGQWYRLSICIGASSLRKLTRIKQFPLETGAVRTYTDEDTVSLFKKRNIFIFKDNDKQFLK